MKTKNNSKYILYAILFIIFVSIRLNYLSSFQEIENISFKSLAISNCIWPFGIIKETIINDTFLPSYYLIIGLLKNEILIRIFNTIVSLINIFVFVLIGKKLLNEKLGIFLALLIGINHFFLYYTSLIAPYCVIFLLQTLTIYALICYLKTPNKRNFKFLSYSNILLILFDSFGFLYVLSEIFILFLFKKRKKIYQKHSPKLLNLSLIPLLIVLPILIAQYIITSKLLIPNTYDGIGLNLNSIYLILSEYFSPHLSFLAPDTQTKSTLGLLWSFFLNPDIKNINTLKILITLFYSTILPIIIAFILSIKTYQKNYRIRILLLISLINTGFILFLMLIEKINVEPIYTIPFFITILIIVGYGIFRLKDIFAKIALIICIMAIQLINPELNSFDITIKKNHAVLNPVKNFINDYEITKDDTLIMPHCGNLGADYFRKLTFLEYDNNDLRKSKKNGILRNISSKKTKSINKKNIHHLTRNYLLEERTNNFLMTYFTQKIFEKENLSKRYVLIIDKLNSRPISQGSIIKYATENEYNYHTRKISLKNADLSQNQSKNLYDALKSKTLYNLANILNINFKLDSIAEYKKIDNEYYKIPSSDNIYKAISSYDSDYVFLIFK